MSGIDARVNLGARGSLDRLLLWGGVVGPLLFILVFLIEDATRPGYSPWRDYVSSLDLSNQGWEQIANFLVCGVLALGFAIGLRRVLRAGKGALFGPILLGIYSLGLIVAGLFVTDPTLGYPPGAPPVHTAHGTVHGLAGLVVFTSLPAACFVLARRFAGDPAWRGWALYSVVIGLLVLVCFVAMMVTSVLDGRGILPNSPTGLLERMAIIAGWTWLALFAWRLLRQTRAPSSPR